MFALLVHSLALIQSPPAVPQTSKEDEPIVVKGERPDRDPDKVYVPLGSWIEKVRDGEGFQSIASNTGFQGLVGNGSAGFDGTGGSVPGWRRKIVTECKASDPRIGAKLACSLVPVEKALAEGDYATADAKLSSLKPAPGANAAERYVIAYYRYLIAAHFGNDGEREEALKQIVATGELSPADRAGAHKTLAAMALKRGDDPAAIRAYELLLASAPPEPQVKANLAALYDRTGRADAAREHMREAIALTRARGGVPPENWLQYIGEGL